jgi:hypothetical protein
MRIRTTTRQFTQHEYPLIHDLVEDLANARAGPSTIRAKSCFSTTAAKSLEDHPRHFWLVSVQLAELCGEQSFHRHRSNGLPMKAIVMIVD